jgi:hypothetical protein
LELLLSKVKLDVEIVGRILKERDKGDGLVIKVANVKLPDPSCTTANAGAALLSDDLKLSQCLVDDDFTGIDDEYLVDERWGTLFKWWRVVNRAFAIAGIFASLRARKKVKGVKLKDRYVEAVKRLKQQKVYSYAHACTYDRLGRFLLEFPQFVYQLQVVSWADWFQNVDDGAGGVKKLIKCLEVGLIADDDVEKSAFWKQPPAN